MTAHTFESIIFVIIATIIVCAIIGIGALINHHLVMRRLNRMNAPTQVAQIRPRPIYPCDLN